MWATFKSQGRAQQPPEGRETRGHTKKNIDNEMQAKLQNVIKGNTTTSGSNTKREV